MDLSIIIVNWNSAEYVLKCVASIYRWTNDEVSFEVVVVDNASPSDDVGSLKERFPEITLIKSSKNLGFAGANNLGFRSSTGDYILFLNPDTRLESPAINIMMRGIEAVPDAGIVGCKLLNADLSVQTSSIMKFPRIWNAIFQVEYFRLRWPRLWGIGALFTAYAGPVQVEAVSGACMLVKREVFERIDGFSEEYFMYSEDVDLCYQAIRAGFKNYYIGDASIVHYGGTSSPREWQTAVKTKAQLHFCEKNYGPVYSFLFWLAMVINASARLLVLAAMRFFARVFRLKHALDNTWLRWSVTLKTLVKSRRYVASTPAL